jgi:acetyl/propionyl-CoA carboxylase alpha subunit
MPIRTVLVANRGEIAVRVIRACRKLGLATVAVFSDADANSLHVRLADQAVHLGASVPRESYLDQEKIIAAAKRAGADAIHPGYGFLSENASFSARCKREGITFIGPTEQSINMMGSKREAKLLLAERDKSVPLIPGYDGASQDVAVLKREALRIGFPLLLKASAGGGGKGMKIVYEASALDEQLESAKREAKNAFGDDTLILERYIEGGRHIEFQVLGDNFGHVVHCFERECSVQRRYQKIIEETPSPLLDDAMRSTMGETAVAIARAISYSSAGTVEFIVDSKTREYFFLEVNTRIQVEHPITEAITGLDLVALQIQVADNRSLTELGITQASITRTGHAIECRLCAEDPSRDFLPSTGRVSVFEISPELRCDTGIESGSDITIFYDSMIAKLIVHAPSRGEAIAKMLRALRQSVVMGSLKTNQSFLIEALQHQAFLSGDYNTHFIPDYFASNESRSAALSNSQLHRALIAASSFTFAARREHHNSSSLLRNVPLSFSINTNPPQLQLFQLGDAVHRVEYDIVRSQPYNRDPTEFRVTNVGSAPLALPLSVVLFGVAQGIVDLSIDGHRHRLRVSSTQDSVYVHHPEFGFVSLRRKSKLEGGKQRDADTQTSYRSPLPGKVLKILVNAGEKVVSGQALLILESMKMESRISAVGNGVVEQVFVSEGQLVEADQVLVELERKKK